MKAPRVQRNALFFAEGCGRRPFSGQRESASRGRRSRESGADAGRVRTTELATPAREVPDPRQEVSEPIGLGPSSRRAQARREELEDDAARAANPFQPLTREHSASSLRKEPTNRSLRPRSPRKQGVRDREAGSFDPQVVLVDRFDCRSRRAACGVVRSRAKSSRKRRGLAPPHRSEERKSVGSRTRVAKSGARWRVRVRGAGESRHRAGNSSREGASGRETHLF
jgi:hypothetical protein